MTRWQEKWNNGTYGRWTWTLIPDIQIWLDRNYGEVDYFLTQALSGHGCLNKYLYVRKKLDSDKCNYCEDTDDAEHTLFVCPRWIQPRDEFRRLTGRIFNMANMMGSLVATEESWNHAYTAIRHIIETKELESRN